MLKKIVDVLPALSVILMINAIFSQVLYYYSWGINILHFVSFDELLVLFLKDFALLIVFFIVFFFHTMFLTLLDGGYSEIDFNAFEDKADYFAALFKKILNNSGKNIAALCFIDIIGSISTLGFFSNFYLNLIVIYSITSSIAILLFSLFNVFSITRNPISRLVTLVLILMTVANFTITKLDVYQVKENSGMMKARVTMGDISLETSKNYYIIGKTKSHLIFYDRLHNKVDVYKSESIDKMELMYQI